MSYSGEQMNACGAFDIDCSKITVVAVSGDGPNVCGHLLIRTGGKDGPRYFHVDELHNYPKYMTEAGYHHYLTEAGKTELKRIGMSLPDPQGALLYLESLMANKWTWLVLPNNCVAFVEEVIKAGGGEWASYSNCPSVATAEPIPSRIRRLLRQLEGSIYRLYRVPYN